MPLLEIIQIRHVTASIRLDESTATQIDQYAAFLHASADEVVDKTLSYVFAKDREFQEYLRTPEAQKAAPSLRIRALPQSVTVPDNSGKAPKPAEAGPPSRSHP
jgi:hypothetical protein